MECLRIKFILPNNYPLSFEDGKLIELVLPEGKVGFEITIIKDVIYTSYTLKSQPLDIKIAQTTIEIIENALFLSFNKFDVGLLINSKLASGVITEHGKKLFGENVDSDFVGVKLVDCTSKHLSISASLQGSLSGHSFSEYLNENINKKIKIDRKLTRAIELYNSTKYLTRVNSSGRFILLMSAIECLISQKKNISEVISIIHKTQEEIRLLKLDEETTTSIVGSLAFLEYELIKRSGKSLIRNLFMDSKAIFNELSPVDFFSKAYNLRSILVHEGKTETKHLNIENAQMQEFTISCLRKYYERNYG